MWMIERARQKRKGDQKKQKLEKDTDNTNGYRKRQVKSNWILTWCILVSFCQANENGKIGFEVLLYLSTFKMFAIFRFNIQTHINKYIAVIFAVICWFGCTNWNDIGTVWLLLFWWWMYPVYECRALGVVCMLWAFSLHTHSLLHSLPFSLSHPHTQSLSVCVCVCTHLCSFVCRYVCAWISLSQYHHFIRLNSQRFEHHSYDSIDSVQIVTLFWKHLTSSPVGALLFTFFCENIPKQEQSEQTNKKIKYVKPFKWNRYVLVSLLVAVVQFVIAYFLFALQRFIFYRTFSSVCALVNWICIQFQTNRVSPILFEIVISHVYIFKFVAIISAFNKWKEAVDIHRVTIWCYFLGHLKFYISLSISFMHQFEKFSPFFDRWQK